MKRIGNLYEEIISIENLKLADNNAQKGKGRQFGIVKHNKNREENIPNLHETLKNKTYKTSEYKTFVIFEPKRREISRLEYFPNRIVHHAILLQTEKIFTDCFISQTYSCIKGRGIHKCLNDLNKGLKDRENTKYCLKIDIKKFYPSINKKILKLKLRTKFKDSNLLNLFDEIIDSNRGGGRSAW